MLTSITKYLGLFLRADLILPVFLIVTYVIFLFIARGVVPSSGDLVSTFAKLYSRYGYEIIFIAALLETLALVNLFVPGQLAMAMGAVFARTGQTDLALVILTAGMGSIIGYILDYVLGYFGFGEVIKKFGYGNLLKSSQKQLNRFGKRGLILGFFHTNVGSFLSLIAGASVFPYKIFLPVCILSTFFWLTLWGIVIYSVGDIIILLITKYSFLLVIGVVVGLILNMFWKNSEEKKNQK